MKILKLVSIPKQKRVDVGALAVEESPHAYPQLYKELQNKVEQQYLHEFVCVTWVRDYRWHGQPDGFYHNARFEVSSVRMFN